MHISPLLKKPLDQDTVYQHLTCKEAGWEFLNFEARLMKKGEIYNVPAQSGITLATGNAGALDILVDGQVISPIGPPGSVRRDVLLEPAALLGGSASSR